MISDEMLEEYVRQGLESAEATFWEHGQSPNAVALFNDADEYTFVYYDSPEDRQRVMMIAMLHKATAAVMVGETWFREMSPEEDRDRVQGSLADDPRAEEEVFALGLRANESRGFRMSKQIHRGEHGTIRLEDRMSDWMELESWLRDALEQVFTPAGEEARKMYADWTLRRASDVVKQAFGGI